ncbi:hypothetical protein VIGAN_07072300 [Vigna angularis var. angularis]|uniref:Uncharacterized protein n=1 Tax=Vigna angularis var. angularis TaxID=157739 RepID=A0A0S3SGV2_PHAAN|nr:hypothetical protein VIGAN_07072300 [Vigna angularis var. angularis]
MKLKLKLGLNLGIKICAASLPLPTTNQILTFSFHRHPPPCVGHHQRRSGHRDETVSPPSSMSSTTINSSFNHHQAPPRSFAQSSSSRSKPPRSLNTQINEQSKSRNLQGEFQIIPTFAYFSFVHEKSPNLKIQFSPPWIFIIIILYQAQSPNHEKPAPKKPKTLQKP